MAPKQERPEGSKEEEEEEDEDVSFDSDDFEDSEEEGDGDDEEDDDEEGDQEVETSFEFFDPTEGDFLGMKGLLKSYLDQDVYDCSGLVDHVIKQKTVGSVVRLEEQLDPIAVVSVVNLRKHRNAQFLADILRFLRENAPEGSGKSDLDKALAEGAASGKVGFVVSERVVNCPLELSSPLQQAIFDEIQWATEDEPTQELRDSFKFTHFVLLSRVYFADTMAGSGEREGKGEPGTSKRAKKQKKRRAKGGQGGAPGEVVYVRPEDEHTRRESDWSFTFPVKRAENTTPGLSQHRLVMGITAQGVARARRSLDKVFGRFLPQDTTT